MALGLACTGWPSAARRDVGPNVDVFEARGLMVAFGLMFLVQNVASLAWGGELRGYDYLTEPVAFGGAPLRRQQAGPAGVALASASPSSSCCGTTLLGKGVRALMQSPVGAQLVGIDTQRLHPLMFGVGLGLSRRRRLPAVDDLHDLAVDGRALHHHGADRHHARRLRQHDRQPGRRPRPRRDRGARHALHQPVAEVAAVVRDLHRRPAVEAERAVHSDERRDLRRCRARRSPAAALACRSSPASSWPRWR